MTASTSIDPRIEYGTDIDLFSQASLMDPYADYKALAVVSRPAVAYPPRIPNACSGVIIPLCAASQVCAPMLPGRNPSSPMFSSTYP